MTKLTDTPSMLVCDVRTLRIDEDFPRLIAHLRSSFGEAWKLAEKNTPGLTTLADILTEMAWMMGELSEDSAYIQTVANNLRDAFFNGLTLLDNGRGKVSAFGSGLLALVVQIGRERDENRKVANIRMAGVVMRLVPKDTIRTAAPYMGNKNNNR